MLSKYHPLLRFYSFLLYDILVRVSIAVRKHDHGHSYKEKDLTESCLQFQSQFLVYFTHGYMQADMVLEKNQSSTSWSSKRVTHWSWLGHLRSQSPTPTDTTSQKSHTYTYKATPPNNPILYESMEDIWFKPAHVAIPYCLFTDHGVFYFLKSEKQYMLPVNTIICTTQSTQNFNVTNMFLNIEETLKDLYVIKSTYYNASKSFNIYYSTSLESYIILIHSARWDFASNSMSFCHVIPIKNPVQFIIAIWSPFKCDQAALPQQWYIYSLAILSRYPFNSDSVYWNTFAFSYS